MLCDMLPIVVYRCRRLLTKIFLLMVSGMIYLKIHLRMVKGGDCSSVVVAAGFRCESSFFNPLKTQGSTCWLCYVSTFGITPKRGC